MVPQTGTSPTYMAKPARSMNRMMLTHSPSTPEKREHFNQLRDAIDPSRTITIAPDRSH